MGTNPRFGHVVAFGAFEVNVLTGELRKHGVRLALQEQPLRILAALLERPGEVVTREALCRKLWPLGTFVDFEHSLNAAVRRLRVTLGDEADPPRFVETVPRRGYRFLAWGYLAQAGPKPGPTSDVGLALRPASQRRLAVLPFVCLAPEPRDAFSDGLTEETTIQLARTCPHVGVIARTSVMRLVGAVQSAAETGRVLGVDYLMEGSVRREGDHLRIVAQLIDTHDETHMWAATFDRVLGNALTVQTDVAEEIAHGVADALAATKTAVGF